MKSPFHLLLNLIFIFSVSTAYSQEFTQTIRGEVYDAQTRAPLPYANLMLTSVDPERGCMTDKNGRFRLEDVPVGRHSIVVSYLGYESRKIAEIMLTSGKEQVLKIGMTESVARVDEVTVKAYTQKDKPLNKMATLSARTFSVEEAQRYAGGMDDPARLASAFAGVSTGYLEDNGIIVRGNAPKGLLWRLEGVEIPNPNHFANMTTFGGGGVSALSSLMLDNSDFFTGAFPAEYGNAISGVFDLQLRTGNSEQYEHAVRLGTMGIDLASEGPIPRKNHSSYLFNYRYSTFGLIKPVLPEETNVPVYQDLSYNINLPTENLGNFSLWGLAADDQNEFIPDPDTSKWEMKFDQRKGNSDQKMFATGLNHRLITGDKTWLNSSLAVTGSTTDYQDGTLGFDGTVYPEKQLSNQQYKLSLNSALQHKFSARHSNKTGIRIRQVWYNTRIDYAGAMGLPLSTIADESGETMLFQAFTQSKLNFTKYMSSNIGLNVQHMLLNNETIFEPRIGLTYNLSDRQSISLAYGKHSRTDPMSIYFSGSTGNDSSYPNKDLRLSKSHHLVFAWDYSITPNLRLKVEPYYQHLYDIPVVADSSYSVINMEADWFLDEALVNTGTGTNYGIDITLERFLKDGYYYLATVSLFESKYTGGDGIQRDTRFNSNYVVNLLFGKEWTIGKSQNKILGINGRLNFMGGQRIIPVNHELSAIAGQVVYDYSRAFEEQKPHVYHVNATVNYRVNKEKTAHIFSVQIMNLLGTKEFYGYHYNYRRDEVEMFALSVVVPNISYKLEF
jgi:hypothetical protein